ncbi:MAG TPA: NAD(P)H-dependent glycerol-3-phosphate dehydrogenase [Rickettsiales bacterium]|nr:NAD(P)H-dependent glycerol-3-phosphate dehydrogenase [Rickettsiales bacterium]
MTQNVVVVGAGIWGTAIANLIAQNNFNVCAISDVREISEEINQKHSHSHALPQITLDARLRCSIDLNSEAKNADFIFIVVPSNVVLKILQEISKINLKPNCGFVIATKGLEHSSLKFFHQIFAEIMPNRSFAVLAGPNFAIEVAQKIPTITNIVTKNENFAREIAKLLENSWFKTEFLDDVLTAEISSVIKNIMAIACGICDGLGLGENTKAALIVQGIKEIKLLAHKIDGKTHNLENPAGFGDIFLTCSTTKSRNNSLGHALGQGQKYSELSKTKTYEGAINADAIDRLAKKLGIKLPLCQIINNILQQNLKINEIRRKIVEIIVK